MSNCILQYACLMPAIGMSNASCNVHPAICMSNAPAICISNATVAAASCRKNDAEVAVDSDDAYAWTVFVGPQ